MKNPFSNRDETEFKNPLVSCESDFKHIFPAEQVQRFTIRGRDGTLINASKDFCPYCFLKFINENISGIDET